MSKELSIDFLNFMEQINYESYFALGNNLRFDCNDWINCTQEELRKIIEILKDKFDVDVYEVNSKIFYFTIYWNRHDAQGNPYWEPKKKIDINTMNQITLDVGTILTKYGIDGYQYNESMNCLRSAISDHLEEWKGLDVERAYEHIVWQDLRNNTAKV